MIRVLFSGSGMLLSRPEGLGESGVEGEERSGETTLV